MEQGATFLKERWLIEAVLLEDLKTQLYALGNDRVGSTYSDLISELGATSAASLINQVKWGSG